SLTAGTFKSIGKLLGLVDDASGPEAPAGPGRAVPPTPTSGFGQPDQFRRGSAFTNNQSFTRGARGFNTSVNFTMNRVRPTVANPSPTTQTNIDVNTSFSPTRLWQLNWSTQYNGAEGRFEAQRLNLTRDLHDWRATFSFMRSPNGNFSFSFLVTLIDLPDIKFDYRQTTLQP
ncbi:MAG: hypothetical protein AB7R55_23410, partial [Gemmatimonadales bacterium]